MGSLPNKFKNPCVKNFGKNNTSFLVKSKKIVLLRKFNPKNPNLNLGKNP